MGSFFSTKLQPEKDLANLKGKVIIVTGGNAGIGYHTVQFLVRRGAKIYMGARNEKKAKEAIEKLTAAGLGDMGGSITWLEVDLSQVKLAKKAAERFLLQEKRLDILVNNAGMMAPPFNLNAEGLSEVMVTNHLAPFAFTNALLPLLRETSLEKGSDVRIVNVSSKVYDKAGEITNLVGRDAMNRPYESSPFGIIKGYAYSKLANVLHSRALQQYLDDEGANITCISLHPGSVYTPGVKNWFPTLPGGRILLALGPYFFRTEVEGAMTSAFAAAALDVRRRKNEYKAAYLVPLGKKQKIAAVGRDNRLAEELWNTSQLICDGLN